MKRTHLSHQFVEFIPEQLEDGVLYVSQKYGTAAHMCCCGCGKEVITPLNPTDWNLRSDGNFVTLHPSIGNWSLPCRSHYLIQKNKVVWAGQMSQQRIEFGRAIDRTIKQKYFEGINRRKASHQEGNYGMFYSLWLKIKRWCNSLVN